jgi:hypothetical protein
MSKATFLSSASVFGLLALAAPAIADPDMTGVAQFNIGAGTTDGSFFAGKFLDDPFLYGGKAQGYWTLSPDVHVQVDVFAQQTDHVLKDSFGNPTDSTKVGGAIHFLHMMEGEHARFGVAGSIWGTDVFLSSSLPVFVKTDSTYGLGALEGQVFGADWTATGQAGVFTTLSCDVVPNIGCPGVTKDGTFIRGKFRYFLNDNTAFSVEGTQMWGTIDDDLFGGKSANVSSLMWTLEGEHRFHDSPFAGFITLTHEHDEANSFFSSSANTQTVSIGIRFYLDQASVKTNDQRGASIDTPTFGQSTESSAVLSLLSISP